MTFDRINMGPRRLGTLLAGVIATAIAAGPALAQPATPVAATSRAAGPSTNAMANLIELLVKQGTITRASGDALIRQAEAEAAAAREAAAPVLREVEAGALPPAAPGTMRVPYVPEVVRKQIRDEVKAEVMAQARTEGWAAPNLVPSWVKGVTLSGDVRFRSQSELYSKGNSTEIVDFATFNLRSPIDLNARPLTLPFLNTRENRINRFRLRARLGLTAKIGDMVTADFRLATGEDNSPIATNQILGGGLAKKNIWLDLAYLRVTPTPWISATFGRAYNPFRSNALPSDLLYDDDLHFDGVSSTLSAASWLPKGIGVELTGGAFPLDFGADDFPVNNPDKQGFSSKWLFAGQIAAHAETASGLRVDASAGYHSFKNVQGQLSSECTLYLGATDCSTDERRPPFVRKGNTLFLLRDIALDPANPDGTALPQLVGLTFDYDILDVKAALSLPLGTKGVHVRLEGDYLRNLSYKRSALCRFAAKKGVPLTNVTGTAAVDAQGNAIVYSDPCTPNPADGKLARFTGGNEGYYVRAFVGQDHPRIFGEWNASVGYRYLQSDAALDAFTDSDFNLGGTNTKGYFVAASMGLFGGVNLGARWLSANEISGAPLSIDVLQIDLSAAF